MLNNWYGPIQTLVYLCALSSKYSFTFFLQAQGSLTHLCQLQFVWHVDDKQGDSILCFEEWTPSKFYSPRARRDQRGTLSSSVWSYQFFKYHGRPVFFKKIIGKSGTYTQIINITRKFFLVFAWQINFLMEYL